MTAPDDLARQIAQHRPDDYGGDSIQCQGCHPRRWFAGWDEFAAHLASVVSRRDADLRTRIEALREEILAWAEGRKSHHNEFMTIEADPSRRAETLTLIAQADAAEVEKLSTALYAFDDPTGPPQRAFAPDHDPEDDDPYARALDGDTRETAPCHPLCSLGPNADHPGDRGYRCVDERGRTLPFVVARSRRPADTDTRSGP